MSAARLPYWQLAPTAFERMRALSDTVHKSGLGQKLLDLVFLRASQINGCAFCIDMHTRNLLKHGEDLQRVNSVLVWHDTDFFSPRECAALAWTEAVTNISTTHAPDHLFDALRPLFSDAEIADLTFAIVTINSWNRLSVAFRKPVDKAALK